MGKRIYLCLAKMSESGAEQRFVQEAFDTNWVARSAHWQPSPSTATR